MKNLRSISLFQREIHFSMTLGAMGQGAGNGLKYLSVSIFRTRYFKSAHNTKCWFCVKTTRNYLNFVRLALCAHKLPIRPRHCLTGFETFPEPCYGFPHNLENFLWGFTLNLKKTWGFCLPPRNGSGYIHFALLPLPPPLPGFKHNSQFLQNLGRNP